MWFIRFSEGEKLANPPERPRAQLLRSPCGYQPSGHAAAASIYTNSLKNKKSPTSHAATGGEKSKRKAFWGRTGGFGSPGDSPSRWGVTGSFFPR